MKRLKLVLTVFSAAAMLTACTKCSENKPVDPPPPVVEPAAPAEPAADMPPTEGAMPGDVSATPAGEGTK